MTKEFHNRPITIRLEKRKADEYHLVFPSYVFISSISHFTSTEDEMRYCRNKVLLLNVLRTLKETGAWTYIVNKQFVKVNNYNENSNKEELQEMLKGIR
jgi:hypothetical protein